jgi:hypothetical protein
MVEREDWIAATVDALIPANSSAGVKAWLGSGDSAAAVQAFLRGSSSALFVVTGGRNDHQSGFASNAPPEDKKHGHCVVFVNSSGGDLPDDSMAASVTVSSTASTLDQSLSSLLHHAFLPHLTGLAAPASSAPVQGLVQQLDDALRASLRKRGSGASGLDGIVAPADEVRSIAVEPCVPHSINATTIPFLRVGT